MPNPKLIETKYQSTSRFDYKDGSISAGLCKDSEHKVNDYYCKINDILLELRDDEVYAIIQVLSTALWVKNKFKLHPEMATNKWKKRKDL